MGSGFCGTDNASIPGDPDNSVVLNANSARRGVRLTWSYPGLNPHAVSFFRIFRAFANERPSTPYRILTSNIFYDLDASQEGTNYYYWIQVVSMNGTYFDPIGPAIAQPGNVSETVRDEVNGNIGEGWLSEELNESIEFIEGNRALITQEQEERAEKTDALDLAVEQVEAQSNNAISLINNESLARVTETNALSTAVDSFKVELDEDVAAVRFTTESFIEQVEGEMENNIGARFAVQVDVNGLIGGFGIDNNGDRVQMGFNVDEFFVGRPDADNVYPFVVRDNQVFINEAFVEKLEFEKLTDSEGTFVVEDGKLSADFIEAGTLQAKSLTTAEEGIRFVVNDVEHRAEFYNSSEELVASIGPTLDNDGDFRKSTNQYLGRFAGNTNNGPGIYCSGSGNSSALFVNGIARFRDTTQVYDDLEFYGISTVVPPSKLMGAQSTYDSNESQSFSAFGSALRFEQRAVDILGSFTDSCWGAVPHSGQTKFFAGCLAFARVRNSAGLEHGDTIGGAELNFSNAAGANEGSIIDTGTWRCLGYTHFGDNNVGSTTLFIKVI